MSQWLAARPLTSDRVAAPVVLRDADDGVLELAMCDMATANAMTPTWVHAFVTALADAAAHPTAKVILLTGLAEHFCIGADRDTLGDLVAGRLAPQELTLARDLLAHPLPIVAAAEGHAIGGGLALLAACDLAVIAREARYGATFMNLGITPGMGMTTLLHEVLGRPLAYELLFTGDVRRGATFIEGVHFAGVRPRSEVRTHAQLLARALAEKPRESLQALKGALSGPRLRTIDAALAHEATMHAATLRHLDLSQWGAP